ncbi:multimeric translocon complex in the outer envelope membrane 132 [Actinidia rufa]|uniref:Multimeric translocon complex in the outer envelope membrane 132 n=1 Tax=Actinidia rufa TaxID=165716 RepID=A0A7J0FRJ0_9ERIC|nr:multimeric translocon complex in the outer envelope membrane 132 [Actinidia rufa]
MGEFSRDDNVEKVGDLGGSVDVDENSYAGNEVEMFEEAIGVPVVADNHEDKLPLGFEDKVEGEVTGKLVDGAAVLEVIDEESVAEKDLGDRLNRMENDVAWEASNIIAFGGKEDLKIEDETDQKEVILILGRRWTVDSIGKTLHQSVKSEEVKPPMGLFDTGYQDYKSCEHEDIVAFELHTDNVEGAKDNLVNLDPELKDDEIRELKEEAPVSPVLLYHNGKNEELKDISNMDLENQDERSCELEYTSAATDSDHHRISLKPEDTQHMPLEGSKATLEQADKDAEASNVAAKEQLFRQLGRNFLISPAQLWFLEVGKSATINSIFDEVKFCTDAFELGTKKIQDVFGTVQGIKVGHVGHRFLHHLHLRALMALLRVMTCFVTQRSHVVQQVIWQAAGDVGLMNPVSLVENSLGLQNRQGRAEQGVLPIGQAFATRIRAPPLPFLLSSLLQSRQLKLPEEQFGDDDGLVDDLDEAQKKSYFDELELREKVFMKQQLKEKKQQRKMMKKHAALAKDWQASTVRTWKKKSGDAASVPVPILDLALPASFDSDNPTHCFHHLDSPNQRYRFLSLASLQRIRRMPISKVEITSSVKLGEGKATSLSFDMQTLGKDMACTLRSEARFSNYRRNKATMGLSATPLGDALTAGLQVEDKLIVN